MEWVEVTGKTIDEAKEAALDQLGVDEADAEFEVIEEPRAGLFGRLRSEARVRARVMPSVPRPKLERRDRKRGRRPGGGGAGTGDVAPAEGAAGGGGRGRGSGSSCGGSGGGGGGAGGAGGRGSRGPRSPRARGQEAEVRNRQDNGVEGNVADNGEDADEVEVAEEFLTGLLETFGGSFTIEQRPLEEDLVELSVQGDDLGLLIGPRGQTLAAVQELARTVVQRRSRGRSGRIILDISGYRQARRVALERFTRGVVEQVLSTGVASVLEPMPPADRKVVHDTVNTMEGVSTTSEGEEPHRRVVISPAGS